MTNEEIAALARELAEELYNDDRAYNSILWWGEEPKERKAEELEHTLRFLLRRYCLVEKEAVRKEYRKATAHVAEAIKSKNSLSESCGKGRRFAIHFLFPEIAKEVEE